MQARAKTSGEIQAWIIDYLATTLGVSATTLGPRTQLMELGVDSVEAAGMVEALEEQLGASVETTVLWEQPTIVALARHLAGEHPEPGQWRHRGAVEPGGGQHPFATAMNGHLARLLRKLGLDKRFVRGEGTVLYDAHGRGYLDFVASYGALPLGHNPPEIWAAVEAARAAGAPTFVQPSYLEAAGELAAALLRVVPPGLGTVTFANSGAEAVEAAIKMCRMATGRPGVLSAGGSFHGKTLGALSATANAHYHRDSGAPVAGFESVPFGDAEALQRALRARPGHFAAVLLEPIQGEGGVVEPPLGYLRQVRRICDEADVPLVFDEVQTGLGRTGAWFACEHEGVVPDAMCLAKALGGGLMPIGAVVAARHLDSETFGLRHSSTFAGGGLACAAGLAVLRRLGDDDAALIRAVAERGAQLRRGLERLVARYPHLVAEVRGRGLLLGLRFGVDRSTWPSSILGVAAEEGGLAPLFAGYMLNVEGVRLAPTLNGNDVVRIEPPLTVTEGECEAVLAGLERGLAALATGDAGRVLHGLRTGVDRPTPGFSGHAAPRAVARPRPGDGRFAFLLHPLELRSYADFDPSLA
ncbi:MAG: aminotransferase class III-fold pyridoxal phosphate-dependent enzyme, partial [Myxococcales bacterium]|nr:aminotransferase class III-fold pyridoxal phosphate-dependent enzyme [Myxococcales bacterium]